MHIFSSLLSNSNTVNQLKAFFKIFVFKGYSETLIEQDVAIDKLFNCTF